MTDDDRLIDTFAAVDVGQGYSLAWCVDTDGAAWPVLFDSRQREPQFLPYRAAQFRKIAPHEMTGRLPKEFQQFWCGARTRGGKACRARVDLPGQRCRHHPETTVAPAPTLAAEPQRPQRLATLFDTVDETGDES